MLDLDLSPPPLQKETDTEMPSLNHSNQQVKPKGQ
jgi:hypothetical protein